MHEFTQKVVAMAKGFFFLKTENGENIGNLFAYLVFLFIFVTLLGVLNLPGLG
jgi:hypothetical protein